jgi:recombination protein RecA
MKIGIMFGSPETTTGGNALKFYTSVRLDIRKTGVIKNKEQVIGNTTVVKVVKNKVAPPFKVANFEIYYGEGISRVCELIDLGVEYGFLEKSGSWYSYQGERLGQGKDNIKEYFKTNANICRELEKLIREKLKSSPDKLVVGGDGFGEPLEGL